MNLNGDVANNSPTKLTLLTLANILALKKWLSDLDIEESKIQEIIKRIIDGLDDGVIVDPNPTPPKGEYDGDAEEIDDQENYKTIKITKID